MKSTPTGEQWTEASVFKVIDAIGAELGAKAIADAHNAALAAEQEKKQAISDELVIRAVEYQQLRKQLAGEQEKWEHLQSENQLWIKRNKQLRKQLAAEREKYNGTERTAGRYARSLEFADNLNQQLREQLAAERGRYRDVTNALGMYPAPVHEKVIAFIQQLRKQLDAEREKHEFYVKEREQALAVTCGALKENQQLREQLDAAVEVLGDMIAEFHDDAKPRNEVIAKAAAFIDKTDAALAKAGKGK